MANIDKLQINGTDYNITATRLSNTSAIGNATTPVYFTTNGVPTPCSTFIPTTGGTFTGEVYGDVFGAKSFYDTDRNCLLSSYDDDCKNAQLATSGDFDYLEIGSQSDTTLKLYGDDFLTYNGSYVPTATKITIGTSYHPVWLCNGEITPLYSATKGYSCLFFDSLTTSVSGSNMQSTFEFGYSFVGFGPSTALSTSTLYNYKLWIRTGRFVKTSGDKTSGTTSVSFKSKMTSGSDQAEFVTVNLTAGPGMSNNGQYMNAVMVTSSANSTTSSSLAGAATYSGFYYNASNTEAGYIYYTAIGFKRIYVS